jgi:SAM-dependent methyltransferase
MLKLNLGSGYTSHPDFINIDQFDYGNNIVADIRVGLPFPDDHFDFVLANHTLQMFTYEELPKVILEVLRVMKKGATFRIITPDILKAFDAYIEGDRDYFPIDDTVEVSLGGKLMRYIFWHGDTRSAFLEDGLVDLLWRYGFDTVQLSDFGKCELDSRESESLILEARK